MADISVTAANVLAGTGASVISGTAGETLTAGLVVYKNLTDNKYYKAAATSAAAALAAGITLNGAAAGQPINIQTSGNINPGGTVGIGTVYVVSDTAGGIRPVGDSGTGDYVTKLGIGTSTSNIALQIQVSGVAVP